MEKQVDRRAYFVRIRKEEKNLLLETITSNPDKTLRQILAKYCNETGIKLSTLQIYLDELIQAGLIKDRK